MGPTPRLTESRRLDILGATASAIAERGLCDTRIADVAAIVGVSPALILYYFPNKAALLTEALVYLDRLFHDSVAKKLASASSAEDKLVVIIKESCPRATGPDELPDSWILWPATWEMSRLHPGLAAARARLDEAWRSRIEGIVEEGIAAGEFDPVDAEDFSIQLAAMLDGLAIEAMLGDTTVGAQRMSALATSFASATLRPAGRGE